MRTKEKTDALEGAMDALDLDIESMASDVDGAAEKRVNGHRYAMAVLVREKVRLNPPKNEHPLHRDGIIRAVSSLCTHIKERVGNRNGSDIYLNFSLKDAEQILTDIRKGVYNQ